jgi:DNA-directed RNA polymerase sigma subunit (sigma70/sigma32)
MEDRSLRQYCEYVLRQPKLTAEEERKIAREAKAGKPKLLQKIILSNLDIAIKQAWRTIDTDIDTWDLIQAGNYGLCYAANDYDPEGTYPFKNVANIRVFNVIKNTISACSKCIRIPANKFDRSDFIYRLKLELEYDDSDYEDDLKEKRSFIRELIEEESMEYETSEIEEFNLMPMCRMNFNELKERIEHGATSDIPDALFHESLQRDLLTQLRTIDDFAAEVIKARFGITRNNDETLQEIGDRSDLLEKEFVRFKRGRFYD